MSTFLRAPYLASNGRFPETRLCPSRPVMANHQKVGDLHLAPHQGGSGRRAAAGQPSGGEDAGEGLEGMCAVGLKLWQAAGAVLDVAPASGRGTRRLVDGSGGDL